MGKSDVRPVSSVLLVDDALFELHAPSANHPERPARLSAARAGVKRSGVATRTLPARDAERSTLASVHAPEYLDALDSIRGKRGMLDADTYVAPRSIDAAVRAAGGTAALGELLARGEETRALALVRPPGHHAERDHAMGFCLLNNVAVAASAARSSGAAKVAVVDIDVHHGNGTQDIFEEDPDVLYLSLHQWPFYPGTGAAEDRGRGAGLGATVNVPLSEGAGDAAYDQAMRRIVVPALRAFAADVVLVSAGFDAFVNDPLAMMALTPAGYGEIVRHIVAASRGKVGMVLEGGYDLDGLEACLSEATRALVDDSPVEARELGTVEPRHRADIDRAARVAAQRWPVEA